MRSILRGTERARAQVSTVIQNCEPLSVENCFAVATLQAKR